MSALSRSVIAGIFVLSLPILAQAEQLKLAFNSGTVSIDADAVPLRAILDAWATLGGTRIDGIDRLPEVAITLHLDAIPEDEALAELLKGRNAFATVPRKPGDPGASQVARIAVFGSSSGATTTTGARQSSVPADWPFPVNENPDGEDRQPPTTEIRVERPGVEIPWPFPIDETVSVDVPATGVLERPGVDIPWPFPVNLEPTLELAPPIEAVPVPVLGVDVPWPFPLNPNPVDSDAPAAGAEPPAAAEPPRDQAGTDPAATEAPTSDAKKPATKTKRAPVSTKAPKPIPPRKPQPRDR